MLSIGFVPAHLKNGKQGFFRLIVMKLETHTHKFLVAGVNFVPQHIFDLINKPKRIFSLLHPPLENRPKNGQRGRFGRPTPKMVNDRFSFLFALFP